jgi:hypothetical protein
MPVYRVTVSVRTLDHVEPDAMANHVADAVSCWGGQYHPDDPLFSAHVRSKATCRGVTMQDADYDTFLGDN